MVLTMFLQGAAAAASAGMGCGTCFGSGMGAILSTYLLTHAKNISESFHAVFCFFLGKAISTATLCIGASIIGERILSENGSFFGIPVRAFVDGLMILMGICFLWKWLSNRRKHAGETCGHCEEPQCKVSDLRNDKIQMPVFIIMGLGYGITPCAPLMMVIGFAATLPIGYAAAAGCIFALFSAISPLLLLFLLSGVLAAQMYKEIPHYLSWFQLGCYLLLTILFTADFIRVLAPLLSGN